VDAVFFVLVVLHDVPDLEGRDLFGPRLRRLSLNHFESLQHLSILRSQVPDLLNQIVPLGRVSVCDPRIV